MKKYNILDNAKQMELLPDEKGIKKYVTQDMLHECLKYNNSLLVAGAGSGKTTTIYNYVLNNETAKVVLTVPTTLLAKNLDEKYGDKEFVGCFYKSSKHKFNNQRLIIMTYDQFNTYKNRLQEYVLITDEVHEGHQFKAINEHKRLLLDIMFNSNNKKIHLTASPYNLCVDEFDKIIYGKQDLNNKTFNIYTSNSRGCLTNAKEHIIKSGHKCLVFINSKAYAKKMEEDLKEKGFKVLVIFSENQDDDEVVDFLNECENIKNWDNKITYDHVIVSKVMNIGYDLNYVFDEIIYVNPQQTNICINSFLQISARDRQTTLVSAFYNKSNYKNNIKNINTFNEDVKINQNVDAIDKNKFNNTYNSFGEVDKNYSISTKSYNIEHASFEEVQEVLNSLYTNYVINHFVLDNSNNDNTIRQTLGKSLKNMNITADELLKLFYKNDTKEIYKELTTNNQIKLTKILHTFKRNSINPEVLKSVNIEDLTKVNIIENYGLKNSDKIVAALDSFLSKDYYTSEYVSNLCSILNDYNLKVNGKHWNNKNFKSNMEHFGIYMKKIKLNKEQHEAEGFEFNRNSKKEALIDVTIQLSDLIEKSNMINEEQSQEVAKLIIDHSDKISLINFEIQETLKLAKQYRELFLNENDITKKIKYNNETNILSSKLLELQHEITRLRCKKQK